MVQFETTADGLNATLGDTRWSKVLADIALELEHQSGEIKPGSTVRVATGDRVLTPMEVEELTWLIELKDLKIKLVKSHPKFSNSILLGKWLAKNKLYFVLLVVFILCITFYFYGTGVEWTGFGNHFGTDFEVQPGPHLWEWLQVLVIPIVLGVTALLFNRSERRSEQTIARDRDENTQRIAANDRHERELQAYFDKMTELLLKEHLVETSKDSQVRAVARARTLTVLRSLDSDRQLAVLRFLREISKGRGLVISDQVEQNFPEPSSEGRYDSYLFSMNGATLSSLQPNANFSNTYLCGLELPEGFDLHKINLDNADLRDVKAQELNLSHASLQNANLSNAVLSHVNLSRALLEKTDLKSAWLSGADFSGARGLVLEQLASAKSFYNVTMPDGRTFEGRTSPSKKFALELLSKSEALTAEEVELVALNLFSPNLEPDTVEDLAPYFASESKSEAAKK